MIHTRNYKPYGWRLLSFEGANAGILLLRSHGLFREYLVAIFSVKGLFSSLAALARGFILPARARRRPYRHRMRSKLAKRRAA